ncbi:alkaline phosphatase D family protein [Sorangium sp. So ce260]|uniref:alkaline phosphatase D family protein n=1 Tax=Sorangium sp. So ce260 TaxID=3133291 RepID=UPI003F61CB18
MLKRRDFLRATLVTAGALAAPACGGDPEIVNPVAGEPEPERELADGSAYFPQSVASGDPRPGSVVLWARVQDGEEDLDVEVEVATDAGFTQRVALDAGLARVKALAKHDHCVKVKVRGLSAGTVYYYRFVYVKGDTGYVSRVGRTKTAPAEEADVKVRFAYVSCQDYIGRFYNTYLALAEEELDFFVHLGDYIYETTGDPSFQSAGGRRIDFTDAAGAIAFGEGDSAYHAARSLSNYRELYRAYRSDANLQKVHESFPMIATWDDHEFSNDAFGATATYFDDRKDETDVARRKAANQAWFEYQPVDYGDDAEQDPGAPLPDDFRIYRDFVFGRHVHLVMTDLRSYRPDHLIPEGAFPGKVVLDEAKLLGELQELPELAMPYVSDIEAFSEGLYATVLKGAAEAAGYDAADVTGPISALVINQIVASVNEGLAEDMQVPLIPDETIAFLERGIAYVDLGKLSPHSSLGSRVLTVKDTFALYAALRYKETQGASEDVMGAEQESWFLDTMEGSKATWKVWGNEFCLLPLAVDLTPYTIPEQFKRRFNMSADSWDGFPSKRNELLERLVEIDGVVAITGDIHAFYAGTAGLDGDPSKKIVEFVGGAVSSGTFREMLMTQVASDPVLSAIPGAVLLAAGIDDVLMSTETKVNPHLAHADSNAHGYVVIEANGEELVAEMRRLSAADVQTDYAETSDPLEIGSKRFRTLRGESELYVDDRGTWKRWDASTQMWI